MFTILDFTSPFAMIETYLTVGLGQLHFGPLDTSVILLASAVALTSGLNLWRIGEREERETLLLRVLHRNMRHRTNLVRIAHTPWYQQLGNKIAATKLIGPAKQESLLSALVAAGIKGHGHLAALIAVKVCAGAAFVPLCWLLTEWSRLFVQMPTMKLAVLAGAAVLGWHCPEVVLSRLAMRRRLRLESGMPDALDLLVICAQAGLSLDHAIEQVGHFLQPYNRDVAKEFAATAAELRVLPVRGQALENLAERAGLASLHSMVLTLCQSIEFGTSLTDSLKVLAAEMRTDRLAAFEQRATRLPVLLTLPLMVFILPALMVVIGTPLVLRSLDMLAQVH